MWSSSVLVVFTFVYIIETSQGGPYSPLRMVNKRNNEANFRCPAKESSIAPCTCNEALAQRTYKSSVKCSHGISLPVIQKALNRSFPTPVPWLQISGGNIMQITSGAFNAIGIMPIRVEISNSKVRYIADDAFADLNLTVMLNLNGNKLYSVPTNSLRRLPKLKILGLAENMISAIDDTSFEGLDHLQFLILNGNRISSMEANSFGRMPLVSLSLSNNHIFTLNGTVKNKTRLDMLDLSNNRLTSLDGELKGLFNLRLLMLDNNIIQSVGDAFRDLHVLLYVTLAKNNIHRLGTSLFPAKNLSQLDLSTNLLEDISEDELAGLTGLRELNLSGNKITNISLGFKHLPLRSLNLSGNLIREANLAGLVNLTELDLSYNQMTSLVGVFHRNNSRLMKLLLSDNRIESLNGSLRPLRDLLILDITNNRLTTLDKKDFSNNTKLLILKLEGNPLVCDGRLNLVLQDLESRSIRINRTRWCNNIFTNRV